MPHCDCLVIGAGVTGLAIARALARAGREVIVVEKTMRIGSATSSRNSEVIHAGIYYPPGSLKATLCAEGKKQLYDYCETYKVDHQKCGKLVIATTPDQINALKAISDCAKRNGVLDLSYIDMDTAQKMEPEIRCCGALYSPSSGIIDSHGYMLSLLGDAEYHGAVLAFGSEVSALRQAGDGVLVEFADQDIHPLSARTVINAAGLEARDLLQGIETFPGGALPVSYMAKGNYFSVEGATPFTHLVYPVPVDGGLGVHVTIDLAGAARFGPDVEWVDTIDYAVDPGRAAQFCDAIEQYWPAIRGRELVPAYAGIRPKLSAAGALPADFWIRGSETHGVKGLISLLGIESPGLTASLAIADRVVAMCESEA